MSETLRVLLIEDNASDAELAIFELKRAGMKCEARRVDTESDYRRELRQFNPEVILSDFSMPHFDGMAVLSIAREICPDVPFIFVSGTIGEEYAIRALRNGATDYVLKNNIARLPPAVERAVNDCKVRTAQRLAEEGQKHSERRFRALIENSTDAIVLVDRSGKVLYGSPASVRILGYAQAEAGALNVFDMVHTEDLPAWREAVERCQRTPGNAIEFQCRARHRQGSWRALEGTLNDLTGDPAIAAMVINYRDVTLIRRSERLRELEHLVTRALAEAKDSAAVVRAAISAICESERWECGRYFQWDENSLALRFSEGWGVPEVSVQRFILESRQLAYAPGDGLIGKAWESGSPLWVTDIVGDTRISPTGLAKSYGLHGAFVFPVAAEGKTLGVLAFSSREARERDELLSQAIRAIGSQIGQVLRRKQAEEELRRFRVSMDLSGDMIVLIDREHMRFVDVNETICKALGYTRHEMLRLGPQDLVPESREVLEQIYDEMIKNPSSHSTMRSYYLRRDGSRLPFESTRRLIHAEGRSLIVAISRDISERIASENALRQSNERFNTAVRATNDVIWDWDMSSGSLWCNENMGSVFGYQRDDIDNTIKFRHESIHPSDRDRVVAGIHRAIAAGEESWSDEFRFRRRDGTYAFVYDRGHVIRDSAHKAVRMIGAMTDVTHRKEAEERLSYLAQFDTLSGLPNRQLFRDRLIQMLVQGERNNWRVGVLVLDLDRFKIVNDTLGHEGGDKLLIQIAERLGKTIRSGDTVGRLIGDEFAIALSNLARSEDAGAVAQKIAAAFLPAFEPDGQRVFITASIGIAVYPSDGRDADMLLKNADTAMHLAKEQGRNAYRFFLPEMNERAVQRLQLETSLRGALERKELILHYQPKIDLKTGAISGLEALLRWRNGQRLVSPLQFIPILEDTGLIGEVGEWVLMTACRQVNEWQAQGIEPCPIAVNLSARQFQREDLEGSIARVLKETSVSPALVELELTESVLMHNAEEAASTLRNLKAFGLRIAVDDFGTGYSSLAYLKRFPIDALKIDRVFIRDVTSNAEDAAIAMAIINLAHTLNLHVVAEGVETGDQVAFLKAHGCDEIQGFYFAPPLTVEDCTKMLVDRRCLPQIERL
jgi:diguanylate cyclase (GGDEF)-like protein/PAS domain S-box-containing protein